MNCLCTSFIVSTAQLYSWTWYHYQPHPPKVPSFAQLSVYFSVHWLQNAVNYPILKTWIVSLYINLQLKVTTSLLMRNKKAPHKRRLDFIWWLFQRITVMFWCQVVRFYTVHTRVVLQIMCSSNLLFLDLKENNVTLFYTVKVLYIMDGLLLKHVWQWIY
jgi:hypothetical protein